MIKGRSLWKYSVCINNCLISAKGNGQLEQ
jgi:hypothetical protein